MGVQYLFTVVFFKVKFIYSEIYTFKVYLSMSFYQCIYLGNQTPIKIRNMAITLKGSLILPPS